jgi:hypothetical protein
VKVAVVARKKAPGFALAPTSSSLDQQLRHFTDRGKITPRRINA